MKFGNAPVLLRADPPDHGRQRALVNRVFTPAAVRALEPDITELAESLIDGFAERGRVELVSDFAVPLPMTVISNALGVSLDRKDDFKRWTDGVAGISGSPDSARLAAAIRARSELAEFVLALIDERAEQPGSDLISRIVQARIDGEGLGRHEMVEMIEQFLVAGNDTTTKLIATAMLRLASDPALAERLRTDPELIPPFVEEVLRLEPPANGIYRIAQHDVVLDGVEIPAGSSVLLVYASGNRDPDQFERPDECEPGRAGSSPHLAFGFGEHYCVGAGLARAETRIALTCLLARCADLRLDIAVDEIPYKPSFMLHGIQRLPLVFRPSVAVRAD
jgi:cytochrome P450